MAGEDTTHSITRLIARWQEGDSEAEAELFTAIYDELRSIAGVAMRGERPDHTFQPTALVHEAFLRLSASSPEVTDRQHLLALAARVMRRFLIDYARSRARVKRGGELKQVTLDTELVEAAASPLDLGAFDAALSHLERIDPRKAEVIQYRYFANLTNDEIASLIGVSVRTVKRDLQFARAFMQRELEEDGMTNLGS